MEKSDRELTLLKLAYISNPPNPNNFDEYYAKVLPSSSLVQYMYVSKEPILSCKKNNKTRTIQKKTILTRPKASKPISSLDTMLKKKKKRNRSMSDKDSTSCVEANKTMAVVMEKDKKKTNDYNKKIEEIDDFNNENTQCFLCKWRYPEMMTINERNSHVNLCLDNKGEKHKESYLSGIRLAEMSEELFLESKTSSNCPLCGKKFRKKGPEYRMKHIQECFGLETIPLASKPKKDRWDGN